MRGTPCRAFRGDLKILVAGRVRYPDAVVTCTPVPRGTDVIPEPVVVFEVFTASTDRIAKNEEYRATPSIQRYVMLEQTRQAATVFSRAGGDWVGHVLTGSVTLSLPEIGASLPLDAVYADVGFPEPSESP